jgi:hypothetical protein
LAVKKKKNKSQQSAETPAKTSPANVTEEAKPDNGHELETAEGTAKRKRQRKHKSKAASLGDAAVDENDGDV